MPKPFLVLFTLLLALALAACGLQPGPVSLPTLTVPPTALSTPSETPVPMAVIVNGDGIPVPEFEAELARYQQAQASLGNTVSLEAARQTVLNDLEDTLLLEQGALASGFVLDETSLQGRIDALAVQAGGTEALAAWETAHGYTEADFRSSLRRQVAAAWMRDQLVASVPATAEQVHVIQILLYNEGDAQQVLALLQAGSSFTDLAAQNDSVTRGELGWFPRGYLPSQAIEQAAFALQPGQYSAVIQDDTGYHLLYVVERDPARQLSPDALLALQGLALQNWLTQKRSESTIVLAP